MALEVLCPELESHHGTHTSTCVSGSLNGCLINVTRTTPGRCNRVPHRTAHCLSRGHPQGAPHTGAMMGPKEAPGPTLAPYTIRPPPPTGAYAQRGCPAEPQPAGPGGGVLLQGAGAGPGQRGGQEGGGQGHSPPPPCSAPWLTWAALHQHRRTAAPETAALCTNHSLLIASHLLSFCRLKCPQTSSEKIDTHLISQVLLSRFSFFRLMGNGLQPGETASCT